jgi:outer membrane protein
MHTARPIPAPRLRAAGCHRSPAGITRRIPKSLQVASRLLALLVWFGCAQQDKDRAVYRGVLDGARPEPVEPVPAGPLSLGQALLIANAHNERLSISGEEYLQALIDKDRAFAGFLPRVSLAPSYALIDRGETGESLRTTLRRQALSAAGNTIAGELGGLLDDALAPKTARAVARVAGDSSLSSDASPVSTSIRSSSSSGSTVGGGVGGSSYVVHNDTLHRFDVPVSAQVNLFNGFGDVARSRVAEAVAAQRRAALLDLQAAVMLDVARTYYQVIRSERLVEVLANSLKVQDERVRDIRGRQAAGVARPLEVAQTEAQAAGTRVLLVQAQNDVQTGRTVLAYLMGVPAVEQPLTDEFQIPEELPPTEAFVEQGRQTRQDLAAARATIAAARANVDAAISQYFPSVNLNLNAFLYEENYSTASRWNTVLSANLPLFSAGLIEADVRTAWSQLRQALLADSLIDRQVQQDVRVAFRDLLTSRERLTELQAQVRAASEAFHQADQTYNVGLATNLERLTAQDQKLTAQLLFTSEQFNHKVAYLNLLRAAGGLHQAVAGFPLPVHAPESQPID